MEVRETLQAMDERVRIYLAPIDAEAAQRFLAVRSDEDPLAALNAKWAILEDFIHDPRFFERDNS